MIGAEGIVIVAIREREVARYQAELLRLASVVDELEVADMHIAVVRLVLAHFQVALYIVVA